MPNPTDPIIDIFYRAFAGETGLLSTAVSEDWEDIPAAPGQGPGPNGALPVIDSLVRAIADLEIVVHDLVDGRDGHGNGVVATRCELRGTHTGELMGMEPSGRRFTMAIHEFHQMENNRIRRRWHLEDWMGFRRQAESPSPGLDATV